MLNTTIDAVDTLICVEPMEWWVWRRTEKKTKKWRKIHTSSARHSMVTLTHAHHRHYSISAFYWVRLILCISTILHKFGVLYRLADECLCVRVRVLFGKSGSAAKLRLFCSTSHALQWRWCDEDDDGGGEFYKKLCILRDIFWF